MNAVKEGGAEVKMRFYSVNDERIFLIVGPFFVGFCFFAKNCHKRPIMRMPFQYQSLNDRHSNTSLSPTPRTTISPVDTTHKKRKEENQGKKKIGIGSRVTAKIWDMDEKARVEISRIPRKENQF